MTAISTLDHLVIVCKTVEEGVAYCERMLGVSPQKGGQHVRMATHNHLLKLGRGIYLETIAIDPDVPAPDRRRWFGMDSAPNASDGPRLTTFVARTSDIDAAVEAWPALGQVVNMQRSTLAWQITIRDDGALIEGGAVPALIQWPDGVDPTAAMPDLECSLVRLDVFHPHPDRLRSVWERIGLELDDRLVVLACEATQPPYLVAHIDTPGGRKTISGRT